MRPLDVAAADRLLTTTRSVRRRLDLAGSVDLALVRECLDVAQQAPSGSNNRAYRFIVVRNTELRRGLADLYRQGLGEYARATAELEQRGFEGRVDVAADEDVTTTHGRDAQTRRVFASARHLTEHLAEVPVHVVPCLLGRLPDGYDNFRAGRLLRLDPPGDLELHARPARPRLRQHVHVAAPRPRSRGRRARWGSRPTSPRSD